MNAYKTAIARTKLSAPMKWLDEQGKLLGECLDYGCGRGYDCDTLDIDGYDPHFRPFEPSGQYDTITCNYVLNVVQDDTERKEILEKIKSLLTPDGRAYITVRADKANLKGTTSKGTWQGLIELDLPVARKTSGFVMYEMGVS